MTHTKVNDFRNVGISGGHLGPFVLTIRTWKHGAAHFELADFHLIQIAEAIAVNLKQKRDEAIRIAATLVERVRNGAA